MDIAVTSTVPEWAVALLRFIALSPIGFLSPGVKIKMLWTCRVARGFAGSGV
jgi:hypothetical protein